MHISFDFPNLILTAPDLRIIGIDAVLLVELKNALSSVVGVMRICFQYDTTFNLTGYYVSILNFIHHESI
jgi:hypothetical protein